MSPPPTPHHHITKGLFAAAHVPHQVQHVGYQETYAKYTKKQNKIDWNTQNKNLKRERASMKSRHGRDIVIIRPGI